MLDEWKRRSRASSEELIPPCCCSDSTLDIKAASPGRYSSVIWLRCERLERRISGSDTARQQSVDPSIDRPTDRPICLRVDRCRSLLYSKFDDATVPVNHNFRLYVSYSKRKLIRYQNRQKTGNFREKNFVKDRSDSWRLGVS